jgi:hypothetical protein
MRTIIETRILVVAAAALASVSCAKLGSGTSPPGADDNGSVTSASPAAGTKTPAPSTMHVPASPTVVPALNATSPQTAPTPDIETQAPPPSPAVLQAVGTTQVTLDGLAAGIDGTRVRFVDCSESASCTARLEAQSLTGLRDLLQSVSQQQGGVGFVAREQLDGYAGRTFVADVTLGASASRAVPADENALLAN